jgi:hypothetical protein
MLKNLSLHAGLVIGLSALAASDGYGAPLQPSSPMTLTVVDEAWWMYNDAVNWVAVIRNDTGHLVEHIRGRVVLQWAGISYTIDRDDFTADRDVLAPGEETVILARWIPTPNDQAPSQAKTSVTAQMSERTASPYLPEPEASVRLTVIYEGGRSWNWLQGELSNVGGPAWRAEQTLPNEPWMAQRTVPFPALASAVFYRAGRIVGAMRPFDESWSDGHVPAGDTAAFARYHASAPADDFRLFTAIEALPAGAYPLRWELRSAGWQVLPDLASCHVAPCPAIVMTVTVRNASDTRAQPFVSLVFRDWLGRPVVQRMCRPSVGELAPGETRTCHGTLMQAELSASSLSPWGDVKLADIGAISVHARSTITTTDLAFAAAPDGGVLCVAAPHADAPPPPDGWTASARLYLPYLWQPPGPCSSR